MAENIGVFLTGATGFVGKVLHKRLIQRGYIVETNLRYLHTQRYIAIIHLAAVTHTRQQFDPALIEANYILTKEVFKNSCRIIFASSCSAKYDTSPYSQSKMYAEHLGLIHGNALGLRFHNIFGLDNNKGIVKYLLDAKNGSQLLIRGPKLIRDYIYIDDVVNSILHYLKPVGMVLNIESVRNLIDNDKKTIKEILKEMAGQKIGWLDSEHNSYLTNFPATGVLDIGTGIGTSTIDLVSLFTKISGKQFKIECTDPLPSDPLVMISNNPVGKISLEEGLGKMLK